MRIEAEIIEKNAELESVNNVLKKSLENSKAINRKRKNGFIRGLVRGTCRRRCLMNGTHL
jgi:hypothetical protein